MPILARKVQWSVALAVTQVDLGPTLNEDQHHLKGWREGVDLGMG